MEKNSYTTTSKREYDYYHLLLRNRTLVWKNDNMVFITASVLSTEACLTNILFKI